MSTSDAQLNPVATGPAAKIVAQHQEPQGLTFYAGWFCPFAQRVWIALEERGIPYQYKEVNPYKKEPHFLAINPKGLVPAVEYKNTALYESLVLLEFLEDAYPDHKPSLRSKDPVQIALARIWIDHITKNVIPAYMRLLTSQEKEKQKAALEEFNKALGTLAANVKGPYFFGDEFSLVDVAIAPWAQRDYVLKEHRGFTREGVSQKWKEYAGFLENRPSVKNTSSEREHLNVMYGRYLRDESQSEAAKAIREGRPLP